MKKLSQLVNSIVLWLLLLFGTLSLFPALPALAQITDAPHPAKLAAEPQVTVANPPDPALPDADPETLFPHFHNTRFWLSGQANFIFQTHPPFHAPYTGPNSLSPKYEKATSRLLTLYTGVRLDNSTEVIIDIEEAGGTALSTGLGLAGNTDLDIVRNPLLSKAPYLGRGIIHKVFGLSKDRVENQRSFLSLFDELPRRRLELRFGKFSLADFFDVNSIGSDTHFQFNNWTIDNNGAWDYAADTRGYTVGITADFEDRNWGFRFAEALMPRVANGIDLVWRPWQVHSENFEYELRHGVIPKKSGAIRLLAYTNYANMGIYREAIANFEAGLTPVPEITNHPWRITRKYGFGINLEQNLSRYLTAFGRFGWNNGKTESFAYTEVDQTFSGGLGARGTWWHRKQDRAGIAFVSNAICKDHQTYLADGGLGFLLGDGHLNYGRENIVESYYTVHVWRGIYLAPGVQHITNPGYNRDRGPVLVPTFRAHLEF
ncbi:MAG: carbohydrate-selective porin [Candidatus Sulfotelmatobacter sp.]|nr:carbohydrate-selective porin [Candidatus Sulfotelmatobacter sp.]